MYLNKVFSRNLVRHSYISLKRFSTTSKRNHSVCVIGADGGIGSMLSLLLKLKPDLVTDIRMHDIRESVNGVAMDLSHINRSGTVRGYTGRSQLKKALKGADIVVISGGISKVAVMTRENLFIENASIMEEFARVCAEMCSEALIDIVTNPVNSCVPVFCETMRKLGTFNPTKVIGVTTLDLMRISTFIASMKGLDPRKVTCPVVGGHSLLTMVPLLSQCNPPINFSEDETVELFNKVRIAGEEVVRAKAGNGAAQIAMAYSLAYFIFDQLKAKRGKADVVQCGYVANNAHKTKYFATKLLLGTDGIIKDLGLGKLSSFEQEKIYEAIPIILRDVDTAERFIR
ncbi:malate and lactate dehydrogenase [Holotrichia oblita]|uniref:Malate and lactate dehydrogenase n=1 Tax=Holotrichia oblita TaxID=644536 RepID=A0ACB9TDQ2_HOLOL|nr:malate and lactate dehydrogenase [Holotrichia oblita]